MEKKRLIIILLLFVVLTSIEFGIFTEVLWHGWGGFGDPSLEYTEAGENGISFLIFFIPVSAIFIYLIRIIRLCIKKTNNMKELLSCDFICALYCMAIAVGIAVFEYIGLFNPFFRMGREFTAFLIDHFNWMTYPAPG